MTDRELEEERELRFGPERMVFLIDGVFAIAMTLMALEVRLPEGKTFAAGWDDLRGRLIIYAVAFFIISRFWLVNHRQLRELHHVNDGALQCALLFLMGICALPVATSVLFQQRGDDAGPVVFAAVLLALTSLASTRLYWYVSSPKRDLLGVHAQERRETLFRALSVVIVYLLAIPLAYALPEPPYATLVWFAFALIDPIADRLARVGQTSAA